MINLAAITVKEKKTKREKWLIIKQLKKNRQLYVFLILPLIYLFIFKYWPMLGAQIAFKKFNPMDGIWGSPWIGFANFTKFFNSYQFERVMKNTFILSLYQIIAGFPLPIAFALCLNSLTAVRYRKAIQTITYAPRFISTVVLVGMTIQLLNPQVGLLNALTRLFSDSQVADVMGIPGAFPHIYVWSGIWQQLGWNSIIYVAALSSADIEQHEAAQIDGASRFKRVIYIDIPVILPTAIILLILNCGNIMSIGFEKVFLLQNNLNLRTSEVISTYVYKVGLAAGSGDFSYATAIGLFNSIINLFLLVIINTISKKVSETSLW